MDQVAVVPWHITKYYLTCSPMIRHLFDNSIAASTKNKQKHCSIWRELLEKAANHFPALVPYVTGFGIARRAGLFSIKFL